MCCVGGVYGVVVVVCAGDGDVGGCGGGSCDDYCVDLFVVVFGICCDVGVAIAGVVDVGGVDGGGYGGWIGVDIDGVVGDVVIVCLCRY